MAQSGIWFWEGENRRPFRTYLLALLVLAFLLRLPLLFFPEVIRNDGAEYVRHAKLVLDGGWTAGKAPPLYPVLIAFGHLVIPDWELAGILVSVLFGALLVLPVVYLGKELFGEQVGLVSGLFVAVHPFLHSFSGSVMTESVYYFLVAMIVWLGWQAFERGRFLAILLFGLFTSLAYLTRPEGLGYLIVFSLWVLIVSPSSGKRGWSKKVGIVCLAILGFLLLSSPYLIQIRKETGRWGITKKFVISVESSTGDEGAQTIETFTRRKEISLLSLAKNPLTVLKKIGVGFLKSFYVFQQSFNPLLFFLVLLIPLFFRDSLFPLKGHLYLFAYFFFFLGFVLPFLWVARRYASQMIPIAIPWAAIGFLNAAAWVSSRMKGSVTGKKFPALLLIVVLLGLFVQGRVSHGQYRLIQKEVGLWMKDHLPRGEKMMSKMGHESFYAEQAWVLMPEKSYEAIIEEARRKGVRYVVVDESIKKDSPDFLEKAKQGELLRLYELEMSGRWMVVFELVDSPVGPKEK